MGGCGWRDVPTGLSSLAFGHQVDLQTLAIGNTPMPLFYICWRTPIIRYSARIGVKINNLMKHCGQPDHTVFEIEEDTTSEYLVVIHLYTSVTKGTKWFEQIKGVNPPGICHLGPTSVNSIQRHLELFSRKVWNAHSCRRKTHPIHEAINPAKQKAPEETCRNARPNLWKSKTKHVNTIPVSPVI